MSISTILILCVIGLAAGVLSGFVGVGGGLIIVPALVLGLGLTQHEAQGTSLALMLPPIGVLAAYNYWRADSLNWKYAAIIAVAFIIGGYFGSIFSLRLRPETVRISFAILMILAAIKLLFSK
jgi:uncharacterized membrane protein YfcA